MYRLKHQLLTLNNIVVAMALIVAAGLVWGSLGSMQRNYTLERTLERKSQELQLATLQARSLELEREYYKTREYQELAVRERLGKGMPGEKLLVLPYETAVETELSPSNGSTVKRVVDTPTNFEQWMNFLFGRSTG